MLQRKRLFSFSIILFLVSSFSFSFEKDHLESIKDLIDSLEKLDIPSTWFQNNVNNEKFKIHSDIEKYFKNMPEHKVAREEKDFEWYKNKFGLDKKIENGKRFINEYKELLEVIEKRNGIHYEIIVAILGMETNFGKFKGTFYTFNALVSIYLFILRLKKFALNELVSLYHFSNKINKDVYYFIGSFAGATGLAQFIPSSLLNFFVDINGIDQDIDIYDISDCIASIENYIFKNGLNKNTIYDYRYLYKAIFSYNRSDSYVKAVIHIYEELIKMREYFLLDFF